MTSVLSGKNRLPQKSVMEQRLKRTTKNMTINGKFVFKVKNVFIFNSSKTVFLQVSRGVLAIGRSFLKKVAIHYVSGISPNRVTRVGGHPRDLAPGQHSSEETFQWRRAVGDTVSDLTGVVI